MGGVVCCKGATLAAEQSLRLHVPGLPVSSLYLYNNTPTYIRKRKNRFSQTFLH